MGAAMVILVILAQSKHRIRGLIGAVVISSLVWTLTPVEQKARFAEMGEDNSSQTRLTYWRDGIGIMNEYPLSGIGYDAWEPYYQTNYNPNGELPHNIFVEAGSELGYPGLGGFIVLILGTFAMNRRSRRLARRVPEWGPFLSASALALDAALIGYLVSGFFVTVLFYPYFWVNLAFTAALYETTRRAAQRAKAEAPGALTRRKSVVRRRGAAPAGFSARSGTLPPGTPERGG